MIFKFQKFLIGCICLSLSSTSYSQNFIKGYIVTLTQDTINGLIDYRNWEKNPSSIRFRKDLSEANSNFSPLDIAGFAVANETYESAVVKLDKSPYKLNELSDSISFHFGVDTTFLRSIVNGLKSLYLYKDQTGKENYFIKKGSDYEYLLHKNYLKKSDDGRPLLGTYQKFPQQLSEYLGDCASINSVLERVEYNTPGLKKVFRYYFQCRNISTNIDKKEKRQSGFGVVAGFALSKFRFEGEQFPYLTKTTYPSSTTPTLGAFYNFVLPRNLGKWSIYNEFLYTSIKTNGSYREYDSDDKNSLTTVNLQFGHLKLNQLVRYKIGLKSAGIILNAGISNGIVVSETNYKKKESKFYTTVTTDEGKAINKPKKFEQGLVAGLGYEMRKYAFNFRWEAGDGLSDYIYLSAHTNRLYFLVSYKL